MKTVSKSVRDYHEYIAAACFNRAFETDSWLRKSDGFATTDADEMLRISDVLIAVGNHPSEAQGRFAIEFASIYAREPDKTLRFLTEFRKKIRSNPLKEFLIEIYSTGRVEFSRGHLPIDQALDEDIARAFNERKPSKDATVDTVKKARQRLRGEIAKIDNTKSKFADAIQWCLATREAVNKTRDGK